MHESLSRERAQALWVGVAIVLVACLALGPPVSSPFIGALAEDACPFANCTTNPDNTTCCSGTCVDLQTDRLHCGDCITDCGSLNCLYGECVEGRHCTPSEYADYCSNVEPCVRICNPICSSYLNATCFNTVFTNVAATPEQMLALCGPFYTNSVPIRGTCNSYTNGGGYTDCTFNGRECICAVTAPPAFQVPGEPLCQYDYDVLPCRPDEVNHFCGPRGQTCTKQCLYPPPDNINVLGYVGLPFNALVVNSLTAFCNARVCQPGQNCFFSPATQQCTIGTGTVTPQCPCLRIFGTPSSDPVCDPLTYPSQIISYTQANTMCADGDSSLGGGYSGGLFMAGSSNAQPCFTPTPCNFTGPLNLPGPDTFFDLATCRCTSGPTLNQTTFDFFNSFCNETAGQVFDYGGGINACKIPTGNGPCTVADECVCQQGFAFPTNVQYCGFQYEADVCLPSTGTTPSLREIDTCGVGYEQAYWLCALNDTVFSTGGTNRCRPVCVCKPGWGSAPTSGLVKCDSQQTYCNNDDVADYGGFGYVNCTKHCRYSSLGAFDPVTQTGGVSEMRRCFIDQFSWVIGTATVHRICNATQLARCGPATASCVQVYQGPKEIGPPQCECTASGYRTLFYQCDEWNYNQPQPVSACISQCGAGWMRNQSFFAQIPGTGAITGCWLKQFVFHRQPTSNADAAAICAEFSLMSFDESLMSWVPNFPAIKSYGQSHVLMFPYRITRCDCDTNIFKGGVAGGAVPSIPASSQNMFDAAYFVPENTIAPLPLENLSTLVYQPQTWDGVCSMRPVSCSRVSIRCLWQGQLKGTPQIATTMGLVVADPYFDPFNVVVGQGGQWIIPNPNLPGGWMFNCGAPTAGSVTPIVSYDLHFKFGFAGNPGIGGFGVPTRPTSVMEGVDFTASVEACSSGSITITSPYMRALANDSPNMLPGNFVNNRFFGFVSAGSSDSQQITFTGTFTADSYWTATQQGRMVDVTWPTNIPNRNTFTVYPGFVGTRGLFYAVLNCAGPVTRATPLGPPSPFVGNLNTVNLPYYNVNSVNFATGGNIGTGLCNGLGAPQQTSYSLRSYPPGILQTYFNQALEARNVNNGFLTFDQTVFVNQMTGDYYFPNPVQPDRLSLVMPPGTTPLQAEKMSDNVVLQEIMRFWYTRESPASGAEVTAWNLRDNTGGFDSQVTQQTCWTPEGNPFPCEKFTPWYLLNVPSASYQSCICAMNLASNQLASPNTECDRATCCNLPGNTNTVSGVRTTCPDFADAHPDAAQDNTCLLLFGYLNQLNCARGNPTFDCALYQRPVPASWPIPVVPSCAWSVTGPASGTQANSACIGLQSFAARGCFVGGEACSITNVWQPLMAQFCFQGTPYITFSGVLRCLCRTGWVEDPNTRRCTMTSCPDFTATQPNGRPSTRVIGSITYGITQNECSGNGVLTAEGCICNTGWMGPCCGSRRSCFRDTNCEPPPGTPLPPVCLTPQLVRPIGIGTCCDPFQGVTDEDGIYCVPADVRAAYCDTNTTTPFFVCQATPEGRYSGRCCDNSDWRFYSTGLATCAHGTVRPPTEIVTNEPVVPPLELDRGFRDPVCRCDQQWAGRLCDQPTCPLVGNRTCNAQGTCINGQCQASVFRICEVNGDPTGYAGCACQENAFAACFHNGAMCSNQGSCVMGTQVEITYECSCSNGFTGTFCERPPCDPTLCNAANLAGTCNIATNSCSCATSASDSQHPFQAKLWIGQFCQIDVTPQCGVFISNGAEAILCGNNGNCAFNGTGYSCQCTNGYTNGPQGPCTIAPCVPACGVHSYCDTTNNQNICRCFPFWGPGVGQCTNSLCPAGALAPDALGGQCACINPLKSIQSGCINNQCPTNSSGIICGQVHPTISGPCQSPLVCINGRADNTCNCCNNGTCICNWSSRYNVSTGICDSICYPPNSNQPPAGPYSRSVPVPNQPNRFVFDRCVCNYGFDPATNCTTSLCKNGGQWLGPPLNQCSCPPLTGGPFCETNPCTDRGQFNPVTGNCTCFFPFVGITCAQDDCKNGGQPSPATTAAPATRCSCPPTYTGLLCEIDRCAVAGHGAALPGGRSCNCSAFWGGTFCDACLPPYVLSNNNTRCDCDPNRFGPLCAYRICGPAGVVNATGGCVCGGITALNNANNCTQRCGPFGSPNAIQSTCTCQSGYLLRSNLDSGHSVFCVPDCLNGGVYNDTTVGCNCPAGFVQPFCASPSSSSSSSSTAQASSSSSSSSGPSSTAVAVSGLPAFGMDPIIVVAAISAALLGVVIYTIVTTVGGKVPSIPANVYIPGNIQPASSMPMPLPSMGAKSRHRTVDDRTPLISDI